MALKVSKNKTDAQTATESSDGGLGALHAPQKEIILRGETFTIYEWTFGEIGYISENFSPLVSMLLNLGAESLGNKMLLLAVLMRNAELTNGLLAYSIKCDIEWVKAAPLSEGAKAAVELVRLNMDFFQVIVEIFQGMGDQTGNSEAPKTEAQVS